MIPLKELPQKVLLNIHFLIVLIKVNSLTGIIEENKKNIVFDKFLCFNFYDSF